MRELERDRELTPCGIFRSVIKQLDKAPRAKTTSSAPSSAS